MPSSELPSALRGVLRGALRGMVALAFVGAGLGCLSDGSGSSPTKPIEVGEAWTHQPYQAGPAPEGSPVAIHGALSVQDGQVRDQDGRPFQLRGVSSMWLNWANGTYAQNRGALQWMRNEWGLNVIRASMGVDVDGGYLSARTRELAKVETIVKNAIELGVYVIIDWHSHHADKYTSKSQWFFAEMAEKYGAFPNVIYETFNEPLDVSWKGILKPYHESVMKVVRTRDPDNLMVFGTPNWSQDVSAAAKDPIEGVNLAYTLHFYSCSHTSLLRGSAESARKLGLALFVTEWGATASDGGMDGKVCADEANDWLDWMQQNSIGWAAWKLDDCTPDASCLLRPGAAVSGGWPDESLTTHGRFVRDRMKAP